MQMCVKMVWVASWDSFPSCQVHPPKLPKCIFGSKCKKRLFKAEWCWNFDQVMLWHFCWCCFCHVYMSAEFKKKFLAAQREILPRVNTSHLECNNIAYWSQKRGRNIDAWMISCFTPSAIFVGPASDPPVTVLTLFVTTSSVWATKGYEGMFDLYRVCHSRNIP